METLTYAVNKLIEEAHEQNVAVLVQELNQQEPLICRDSEVKMISASTIKVPILLAALENVRKKKISLQEKLRVEEEDILNGTEVFESGAVSCSLYELLCWMIISSDNTATNVIIKAFGMEGINRYITEVLQAEKTELQRYMRDETAIRNGKNNYTSQKDMQAIFTALFNRSILSEELCALALDILYRQRRLNQVMRYICEPVPYAHKTGTLSYVNHDVGVMTINDRLFYVGVSVYKAEKAEGNKPLSGRIGRLLYETLCAEYS